MSSAAEAMAISILENNENKWEWACGVEGVHGGVEVHKTELKNSGKELTKEEKEPPALCSSSKCGVNSCGGWKQEGKDRFWEVEKMIREARGKETVHPRI